MPTFQSREEYEAWKAARAAGAQGGPPPSLPGTPSPPPVGQAGPPALPLPPYDARQQVLDAEHLRLLRIGYLVSAGVTSLMCLLGFLYIGMGAVLSSVAPPRGVRGAPPFPIFAFFAAFGAFFVVAGAGLAVLKALTARALKRRTGYMLCMVSAAVSCLGIPYGTLLGIATFVVLGRPHVKAMFEGASPTPPIALS